MSLKTNLQKHLKELCQVIKARPTGSSSNQTATSYLENILTQEGLTVTREPLPCIDWHNYGASLTINKLTCPVVPADYSTPCMFQHPIYVLII